MRQFIRRNLLRNPLQWQFWLILALLFKGVIFALRLTRWLPHRVDGFWGVSEGDTWSYISPIENLIHFHAYNPDFRMPGYGVIYLPFALMFGMPVAYNILILLQLTAAAFSVYCLALTAKYIFRSDFLFYLTFYLFALSTYSNMYDTFILTESFTTSFLIFSVFFLVKGLTNESGRGQFLVFSGIFLTWVIFMRPVFFPLYLLFGVVIFLYLKKTLTFKKVSRTIIVLLLPIILCDGLWIGRNYLKYSKFLPVTRTLLYPGIENSYWGPLFTFVNSWGGTDQYFEPHAVIRWFGLDDGLPSEMHNVKVSLPGYIYTSKFNYDSLVLLRSQLKNYVTAIKNKDADSAKLKPELETIRNKCLLYAHSVKEEKPFLYYVIAPIIRTKEFLLHSGTNNLFTASVNHLGLYRLCIKGFYSLFYWFVLIFGTVGCLMLSKESVRNFLIVLPIGIVVYTILIHPVILGACEKRYFVPAYPFMLLLAVYPLWRIRGRLFAPEGKTNHSD